MMDEIESARGQLKLGDDETGGGSVGGSGKVGETGAQNCHVEREPVGRIIFDILFDEYTHFLLYFVCLIFCLQ